MEGLESGLLQMRRGERASLVVRDSDADSDADSDTDSDTDSGAGARPARRGERALRVRIPRAAACAPVAWCVTRVLTRMRTLTRMLARIPLAAASAPSCGCVSTRTITRE